MTQQTSSFSALDAKWAERDRLREAAQETLRRKEAARTPAERLESLRGSGVVTAPDGQPSIVVPDSRDVAWAVAEIERLQNTIDSIWDVALDRDMETGVAIRFLIDPSYAKWGEDD